MCIYAQRDCDTILFHHEGGVEIGDVDSKVSCKVIQLKNCERGTCPSTCRSLQIFYFTI